MGEKISRFRLAGPMVAVLALSLSSLLGAGQPATAQQGPSSPAAGEQVIITSPYVVRKEAVPSNRAPGLRNPELVSISRAVTYADLDLSKPSGVAELQTRVRNTARDVCGELSRLYPRTSGQYVYGGTDCVRKATDDGMEAIKQVSAVAGK